MVTYFTYALNPNHSRVNRRTVLNAPVALSAPFLLNGNPCRADDTLKQTVGGDRVFLNPQEGFPLASFGLQVYDDETAYRLTTTALKVGFRNFFASVLAGNQRGFARAVRDSGIPRDQLYICGSVLSNRKLGFDAAYKKTKQGCAENMAAFKTGDINQLDMIMLDYPGPDDDSIRGQWKAFEEMKMDGLVKSLAVSNFSAEQIDAISATKGATMPTVNQLPYSLSYHPKDILQYNKDRGLLVQSWSPLSSALPKYKRVLEQIGKKYNKSAAQVGLRWIIQNGASFCTQSKNPSHFEEDLNVFDFSLSEQEMVQLSQLEPPRAI